MLIFSIVCLLLQYVLWIYFNMKLFFMEAATRGALWKKSALVNFTKFTGKHLCQSLFFKKLAGLRAATSLKKKLRHKCFPVNLAKFLRTPYLQNTSARLLLILFAAFFLYFTSKIFVSKNIRFVRKKSTSEKAALIVFL